MNLLDRIWSLGPKKAIAVVLIAIAILPDLVAIRLLSGLYELTLFGFFVWLVLNPSEGSKK